eukprot:1590281-Rhodomonas_salina.3
MLGGHWEGQTGVNGGHTSVSDHVSRSGAGVLCADSDGAGGACCQDTSVLGDICEDCGHDRRGE